MSDDWDDEIPRRKFTLRGMLGLSLVIIGAFGLALTVSGLFTTDEESAELCGTMFLTWGESVEWANGESVNPLTDEQLQAFHDFWTSPVCVKINEANYEANKSANQKLFIEYEDWKKRQGIEGIIVK